MVVKGDMTFWHLQDLVTMSRVMVILGQLYENISINLERHFFWPFLLFQNMVIIHQEKKQFFLYTKKAFVSNICVNSSKIITCY